MNTSTQDIASKLAELWLEARAHRDLPGITRDQRIRYEAHMAAHENAARALGVWDGFRAAIEGRASKEH